MAVVGLGNPMAGDDGAGVMAVERLRHRLQPSPRLLLTTLEGDLFAVCDLLGRADHFLFVDAVAGERPGELIAAAPCAAALAPSLHQAEIGAVMGALARLEVVDPFPSWELWGVVVVWPVTLGADLSPAVDAGLGELVEQVATRVAELLGPASGGAVEGCRIRPGGSP